MLSLPARTLHAALRISRLKQRFATHAGVHWMIRWRRRAPPSQPPAWMRRRFRIETREVADSTVFTIAPRAPAGRRHIFYLHGGAYVFDLMPSHWRFLSGMVQRTGATITVPRYPLAPESTCPDTFPKVVAAYRDLVERVQPVDLTVMGDSAGGGMALSLAQAVAAEDIPQPRQVVLLSPWLDLTMSHPDIEGVDAVDPFIGADAAQECARLYAGELDPRHPWASPLYGSLTGLPPIALFTGTLDILNPDARVLRDRAELEGVDIAFHEMPMLHTWMLMPLPESRRTRRQIARLVKSGPLQGQRTSGGMEDRIEATLPPVLRPNRVPRS